MQIPHAMVYAGHVCWAKAFDGQVGSPRIYIHIYILFNFQGTGSS